MEINIIAHILYIYTYIIIIIIFIIIIIIIIIIVLCSWNIYFSLLFLMVFQVLSILGSE